MIRRPITELKVFVWEKDKALDRRKPKEFAVAWKQFLEDGDAEKLPLREGCKPAVFKIAPLTMDQYLHCMELGKGARMVAAAARYGVRSIDNVFHGDRPFTLTDKHFDDTDLGPMVSDEAMQVLWIPDLIVALGGRVLEISNVDPT